VLDAGLAGWLWAHRGEVSQRYVKNFLRSIRVYSEYLFTNAFRLGNGWFIVLLIAIGWSAWYGGYRKENLFLAMMLLALPAGVSMGYIFNRYLLAYLPFLLILVSAFVVLRPALWNTMSKRIFWLVIVLVMMGQSSVMTMRGHKSQKWRWDNLHEIAVLLRDMVPENGRVIAPQDAMMIEFDLDHPNRWVKFPFAEPDRFEDYAAKYRASHIVLCTSAKSQYPIYGLFDDVPPPANWKLALEKKYERLHPVWGPQEDIYRIYERSNPATVEH